MAGIGCDVVGDCRTAAAGLIVECDFSSVGIQSDVLVVVSCQAAVEIAVGDVDGARRADREGVRHRVDRGVESIRGRVVGHVECDDVSRRRALSAGCYSGYLCRCFRGIEVVVSTIQNRKLCYGIGTSRGLSTRLDRRTPRRLTRRLKTGSQRGRRKNVGCYSST